MSDSPPVGCFLIYKTGNLPLRVVGRGIHKPGTVAGSEQTPNGMGLGAVRRTFKAEWRGH